MTKRRTWIRVAWTTGVFVALAACSDDAVVGVDGDALIAGTVTSSSGDPLEGAVISIRYEFEDTLPAFLGSSATGAVEDSSAGDFIEMVALQHGLGIDLAWSVDTLTLIDSFMVDRRLPGASEFRRVFGDSATSDRYEIRDDSPEPGLVDYAFGLRRPAGLQTPDTVTVRFGHRLGVPGPNPFDSLVTLSAAVVRPASYSAWVTDESGALLRFLGEGVADSAQIVEFHWDGNDSSGVRSMGGVHRIEMELEGGSLLSTSVFLNAGRDAVTDSTGAYEVASTSAGQLIRVVGESGEVVGTREVLVSIEVMASAEGFQSETREITPIPTVENRLDFTLDPE